MAATKKTTTAAKPRTPRSPDLAEVLAELQAQLASVAARLERLEARVGPGVEPAPAIEPAPAVVAPGPAAAPAPARAPEPPAAPAQELPAPGLSEEEILAVSAALAAFLGVRARIRQIRLLSSPAWAQQGRVSIQASHRLHS